MRSIRLHRKFSAFGSAIHSTPAGLRLIRESRRAFVLELLLPRLASWPSQWGPTERHRARGRMVQTLALNLLGPKKAESVCFCPNTHLLFYIDLLSIPILQFDAVFFQMLLDEQRR